MKHNHTQFAIILDRSGSMVSIRDSTIIAFNEFIGSQKEVPGTADVMLVRFDGYETYPGSLPIDPPAYEIMYNKPLGEVPELTKQVLSPRGSTALNDAIGKTIIDLGTTLSLKTENERPSKVIVAIFTDGGENASTEFTRQAVAALIKEQTEKYNWTFSFFGANQDAVLVGKSYNISEDRSVTYAANGGAIHNTMMYSGKLFGMDRIGQKAPAAFTAEMKSASLRSVAVDPEELKKWDPQPMSGYATKDGD